VAPSDQAVSRSICTELHSTSDPRSSRIFKHRLLTNQHSHLNDHHTATSHSIQLQCWALLLQFLLRRSFRYRDGWFVLPKWPIQIKKSLRSIWSTFKTIALLSRKFLEFHSWHSMTIHYPIFLSTSLPSSQRPSNHIIWEKTFRDRNGNRICRHRGRDPSTTGSLARWITLESGRSASWSLPGDRPRTQNMSSRLDRVGKLIGLWCGHLFELVHQSWRSSVRWRLGGEVRRCERETLEGQRSTDVEEGNDMEPEDSTQVDRAASSQECLFDDFYEHFAPSSNLALTHYDSHSSSSIPPYESSHHLSIYILSFPWWVMCFSYYSFSWFLIWFVMLLPMLYVAELSGTFSLTHCWGIAYWS